jgi:hypothetical protein
VDSFLKLPLPDDDKRKILWDNCARFYSVSDVPHAAKVERAGDRAQSVRD